MTQRRGIYVDEGPAVVLEPGYLAGLRELGLDHIALCVHDSSGVWMWTPEQVARAHALCDALFLYVSLMTWPPQGIALTRHVQRVQLLQPRRWEVDLEGNWLGTAKQRALSATHLVDSAAELKVPLDLTSHSGHGELIEGGLDVHDLLDADNCVWAQAYCLARRATTEPELGLPRGVERPIGRLRKLGGTFQRGLILACWDQSSWQGLTPDAAMEQAYRGAVAYSPERIRWWSSKTMGKGPGANRYARRAIRHLLGA
jgi:hypothetical protein